MKKSGMIAIVGRSNNGKSHSSTHSSAAKSRLQHLSHRQRVGQFKELFRTNVVSGTHRLPRLHAKSTRPADAKLTGWIKETLREIDAVIYVADPTRRIGDEEKASLRMVEHIDKPKLLVINKIDDPMSKHNIDFYRDIAKSFDAYVEASGL